jgi:hypothetical protein
MYCLWSVHGGGDPDVEVSEALVARKRAMNDLMVFSVVGGLRCPRSVDERAQRIVADTR